MTAEDDLMRRVLRSSRTVAVVGLSADSSRPSHFVARYMQQHGYRIIPVNPRHAGQTLLGEPVLAQLQDITVPVDLVNVFRRTEDVGPIAEAAVAIGAKCLWQQVGIANREAAARAQAAGLDVVMDRCLKVEHARLLGGQGLSGA